MTLDLVVLVMIGFFTVWGAFTGIAKQIGNYVALVAAFFAAAPLGRLFGARVATAFGTSATVGVVLASVFGFIATFILVRFAVTLLVRRLLADKQGDHAARDRLLGAGLGGTRAAALCYLILCAGAFIEGNVIIGGRKLSFGPKDSLTFAFAKRHNALEARQFPGIDQLAAVAKLSSDSKAAERLKADPDYTQLIKDPRFKALLENKAMREAAAKGDTTAMLGGGQALDLINDAKVMERLSALLSRFEQ